MKPLALQLYRLVVVAAIAWLICDFAVRRRMQANSPATPAFPFAVA